MDSVKAFFVKIFDWISKFFKALLEMFKRFNKRQWIIVGAVVAAIIAVIVILCIAFAGNKDDVKLGGKTQEEIASMTAEEFDAFMNELEENGELDHEFMPSQAEPVVENLNEAPVKTQDKISEQVNGSEFPIITSNGALKIHSLEKYSGYFIEDGSNVATENALAMVVENISGKDIYFARVELDSDKTEDHAIFEMSFVPAGEKIFVQERNNRKYNEAEKFTFVSAGATEMDYTKFTKNFDEWIDTAYTKRPESNCIIVYNKTEKSLAGKIFYKQKVDGMLYGGKTFATDIPSAIMPNYSMYISVYHFNENSVVVAAQLAHIEDETGETE